MPDLTANFASPRTLDVLVSGQDPGAMLRLSRGLATSAGEAVPSNYQNFVLRLMDLLKQYQQLGTAKFAEAGLRGQEQQISRIMQEATPGMPPQMQAQIRSAQAQAVQPTITGAETLGKTFGEQITGLGEAISSAKDFLALMQAEEDKRRDDARVLVFNSLSTLGSGAFEDLDEKDISRLEQTAGFPKGFITGMKKTLKEKEFEQKRALEEQKLLLQQQTAAMRAAAAPKPNLVQTATGEYVYISPTGEVQPTGVLGASKGAQQSQWEKQLNHYVELGTQNLEKAKKYLGITTDAQGNWIKGKETDKKMKKFLFSPFKIGVRELNTYISDAVLNLAYSMSGRGIYGGEFEKLKTANEPKIGDTVDEALAKLKNIENMFTQIIINPSIAPLPPDMIEQTQSQEAEDFLSNLGL